MAVKPPEPLPLQQSKETKSKLFPCRKGIILFREQAGVVSVKDTAGSIFDEEDAGVFPFGVAGGQRGEHQAVRKPERFKVGQR